MAKQKEPTHRVDWLINHRWELRGRKDVLPPEDIKEIGKRVKTALAKIKDLESEIRSTKNYLSTLQSICSHECDEDGMCYICHDEVFNQYD